ncbi:MAG: FecR domain-containing protein [Leptospiraceae bacterium]|nr:FecR domain-containing protein [Leptospiraceae bacterium]
MHSLIFNQRRTWFAALGLSLILMLGLTYHLMAEDPVAFAKTVEGQVQVQSSDSSWRALPEGSLIKDGDRIKTGANSRVVIQTRRGIYIRLGANTEAALNDIVAGNRPGTVNLERGNSWYNIEPNSGNQGFQVITPTAVAAVRGTKFSIVHADTGTISCVCKGAIQTGRPGSSDTSTAETGDSHRYSPSGELEKIDLNDYFDGLKVDDDFREVIRQDARYGYCMECHRSQDMDAEPEYGP